MMCLFQVDGGAEPDSDSDKSAVLMRAGGPSIGSEF